MIIGDDHMGIKETLARNFRQPSGLMGKLVGLFMNKGNDFMNRFTIDFLHPQSSDRILEIGFGNGKYMHEIAGKIKTGFVAGVDFSKTMVAQARKRNYTYIKQGLMDIKLGEVQQIPFENESFNKVFTVNTIYFWPNPDSGLKEIHRILKLDGQLIISFRSKDKMEKLGFTKHGFTLYETQQVMELVKKAGFRDIRVESTVDRMLDVNCVIAVK
ncbi:MAG: class SAM-dependent methyltransferase [Cohnella sp.]|jgi:ubiquinone/menaquinone biosynthesis C-methylase UbiE|nr:class SAM-dependent methyltransferase [Cohnella sp.]